jgi:ferredoxin
VRLCAGLLSIGAPGQDQRAQAAGLPTIVPRDVPLPCEQLWCVKACPTGALAPTLTDVSKARMGLAVIDTEHCLSWLGLRCEVCFRACPLKGQAITLTVRQRQISQHAMFVPVVHSEACTGCGICEKQCPTEVAAIRVLDPAVQGGSPTLSTGWTTGPARRWHQAEPRRCPPRVRHHARRSGLPQPGQAAMSRGAERGPVRHLPRPTTLGGWLHRERFTLARRAVQFTVLLLFYGTLHAGWKSSTPGGAICRRPNCWARCAGRRVLQALAARHPMATEALLGAGIAALLYALLGGRVFCAWVCPMNMVTDAAAWSRTQLGLASTRDMVSIPQRTRYGVLALALVFGGRRRGGL